eukprot:34547_1
MPAKVQKSKAQKAAAASAGGKGGKGGKKKWSKKNVREQKVNAVVVDNGTYEKLMVAIPKMALITTSSVSERFHVGGSVARRVIMLLAERGEIQTVAKSHAQLIFTRIPAAVVVEKVATE